MDQDFQKEEVRQRYEKRYFKAQFLEWNYEDSLPKGCILGRFKKEFKTPEVESEVLLHCMEVNQKKTTLLYPQRILGSYEYFPIKNHR